MLGSRVVNTLAKLGTLLGSDDESLGIFRQESKIFTGSIFEDKGHTSGCAHSLNRLEAERRMRFPAAVG